MFRPEVWFVSTLFCCGIIASLLMTSSSRPTVEPPVATSPISEPLDSKLLAGADPIPAADPRALPTELPLRLAQELMERVDRELILGRGREAVELLHGNLAAEIDQIEPEFNIRWGLAEELRGALLAAENRYRATLRRQPESNAEMMALSGLSRVWLAQGKYDIAQGLLADLFLQSAKLEKEVGDLWGEVILVTANCYQGHIHRNSSTSGLPWQILSERAQPDIDAIVTILRQDYRSVEIVNASEPAPESEQKPRSETIPPSPSVTDDPTQELQPGITIIQNVSPDPELIFLDASIDSQSLIQILGQISQSAGIEIDISAEARETLTGRSKVLSFRGRNLATVLDSILLPLGLIWESKDTRMLIAHSSQVGAEPREQAWSRAATRMYQMFLLEFSGDSRTPVAQLEQANLAFRLGDIDRAAADYQTLIQRGSKGETLATAYFNLALLNYSRLGRYEIALDWANRAMDQSMESPKQALAQSLVAHIHLQLGRFDSAIRDAGRAVRVDPESPAAEQAALILARSYLLKNEPAAANRAIYEARAAFHHQGNRYLGGFLSCYARYIAKSTESGKAKELEGLLMELSHVSAIPDLTPVDQYLIGRAYQEIGIDTLAVDFWVNCLKSFPPEYWLNRVQFELALTQRNVGDVETNLAILQGLSQQEDSSLAVQSQIQTARVLINNRQWEQGIVVLRSLPLADLTESNQRTVLKLMGNAYIHLEQPHAAALCFAGMLPGQETTTDR